MTTTARFTPEQITAAKRYAALTPPTDLEPRIERFVTELIGRVADKWTMLILVIGPHRVVQCEC